MIQLDHGGLFLLSASVNQSGCERQIFTLCRRGVPDGGEGEAAQKDA